jgi:hypothetical protein
MKKYIMRTRPAIRDVEYLREIQRELIKKYKNSGIWFHVEAVED